MGTCPDTDIDPNFITVNIHNILETTLEELKCVADIRVTFEVQFYSEQAVDSGGLRNQKNQLKEKTHVAFHANFSYLLKHIRFAKRECGSSPPIRQ